MLGGRVGGQCPSGGLGAGVRIGAGVGRGSGAIGGTGCAVGCGSGAIGGTGCTAGGAGLGREAPGRRPGLLPALGGRVGAAVGSAVCAITMPRMPKLDAGATAVVTNDAIASADMKRSLLIGLPFKSRLHCERMAATLIFPIFRRAKSHTHAGLHSGVRSPALTTTRSYLVMTSIQTAVMEMEMVMARHLAPESDSR